MAAGPIFMADDTHGAGMVGLSEAKMEKRPARPEGILILHVGILQPTKNAL